MPCESEPLPWTVVEVCRVCLGPWNRVGSCAELLTVAWMNNAKTMDVLYTPDISLFPLEWSVIACQLCATALHAC